MRRNCCDVIAKMVEEIPAGKIDFILDLRENLKDAKMKAPEETIQWERTQETLQKHIPLPSEDWEWEVLSIFTTIRVDQLKENFKNSKDGR